MESRYVKAELKPYLAASKYIYWDHPNILALAKTLADARASDEAIGVKGGCLGYLRK